MTTELDLAMAGQSDRIRQIADYLQRQFPGLTAREAVPIATRIYQLVTQEPEK